MVSEVKVEMNDSEDLFLTRKQMAEWLQISLGSLDKLNLPRIYVGRMVRFSKKAVRNFIVHNKMQQISYQK